MTRIFRTAIDSRIRPVKWLLNTGIGLPISLELPLRRGRVGHFCLSRPETAGLVVSMNTAEQVEGWVRICVADSGICISPEDCKRIFSEFYRVSDPAASVHAGSGLGLAISKKLVLMHGGEIWAESREGAGTQLIFTLPFQRDETQQSVN